MSFVPDRVPDQDLIVADDHRYFRRCTQLKIEDVKSVFASDPKCSKTLYLKKGSTRVAVNPRSHFVDLNMNDNRLIPSVVKGRQRKLDGDITSSSRNTGLFTPAAFTP